jgi:dynein heavy chain
LYATLLLVCDVLVVPHCRFHKSVFKIEKGLPPNKLVPKLRAAVDEYRLLLPVVSALRNKTLKERHWAKVFAAIGTTLSRDETFTLQVGIQAKCSMQRLCSCLLRWTGCRLVVMPAML